MERTGTMPGDPTPPSPLGRMRGPCLKGSRVRDCSWRTPRTPMPAVPCSPRKIAQRSRVSSDSRAAPTLSTSRLRKKPKQSWIINRRSAGNQVNRANRWSGCTWNSLDTARDQDAGEAVGLVAAATTAHKEVTAAAVVVAVRHPAAASPATAKVDAVDGATTAAGPEAEVIDRAEVVAVVEAAVDEEGSTTATTTTATIRTTAATLVRQTAKPRKAATARRHQ